jgi:Zn-dependent protease with chaperone function
MDAPNRLFLTLALAGSLLGAYAVCGVIEGLLVPVVITSVSRRGWGALLSIRLMPSLMLLAMAGIAMARAGRVLARQVVASRRLAQRIGELAVDAPERLLQASRAAGLSGRVAVIGLGVPVSFVHGVVRPRVVISESLLEHLSGAELLAVLEHERYHVSNLDPLKTATLRVITAALPFLPELEPFPAQYRAGCELAADRRAVAAIGTRPLAGALLKAAGGPDWADTDLAVPLGSRSLLHTRVAQLESGAAPPGASLASARALLTMLSAIALLTLLASAVVDTTSVTHATLVGLSQATLHRGLLCAAPVVAGGLFAYALLALNASRPATRSCKRRRASRASAPGI